MHNIYQSFSAEVATLSVSLANTSVSALLQNVWVLGTLLLLMTLASLWAWKVQTHVSGVVISFLLLTMVSGYAMAFGGL